jgi:hypothetical protein
MASADFCLSVDRVRQGNLKATDTRAFPFLIEPAKFGWFIQETTRMALNEYRDPFYPTLEGIT